MKTRNYTAKHMNMFYKASVEPHKRRSKLEAMEHKEMEENACEGGFMKGEDDALTEIEEE